MRPCMSHGGVASMPLLAGTIGHLWLGCALPAYARSDTGRGRKGFMRECQAQLTLAWTGITTAPRLQGYGLPLRSLPGWKESILGAVERGRLSLTRPRLLRTYREAGICSRVEGKRDRRRRPTGRQPIGGSVRLHRERSGWFGPGASNT